MTSPGKPLSRLAVWRLVGFRTMVLMTVAYAVGTARRWVRKLVYRARPEVETAPEGGE
jgi:hypothetical protein